MGYKYEVHAGEGGDDAGVFAGELGQALKRSFGASVGSVGRVVSVESPVCL